jgi:hypothetical protein
LVIHPGANVYSHPGKDGWRILIPLRRTYLPFIKALE